jgi:uridylate kinase
VEKVQEDQVKEEKVAKKEKGQNEEEKVKEEKVEKHEKGHDEEGLERAQEKLLLEEKEARPNVSHKKLVVLKIGGSFLMNADGPDLSEVKEMAETVRELVEVHKYRVIVVVGGGITARNYISCANQLNASKGVADYLGIEVSRLNARVFIEAIGNDQLVVAEPAKSLQEVRSFLQIRPVVVLGGFQPGQSTTAVSALCAEYCGADKVVYATDVDAVYTADPRKDKTATKLSTVSYQQLRELTQTSDNTLPGQYRIMDGMGLTIIERSQLHAQILQGSKDNLINAIVHNHNIGTIIKN